MKKLLGFLLLFIGCMAEAVCVVGPLFYCTQIENQFYVTIDLAAYPEWFSRARSLLSQIRSVPESLQVQEVMGFLLLLNEMRCKMLAYCVCLKGCKLESCQIDCIPRIKPEMAQCKLIQSLFYRFLNTLSFKGLSSRHDVVRELLLRIAKSSAISEELVGQVEELVFERGLDNVSTTSLEATTATQEGWISPEVEAILAALEQHAGPEEGCLPPSRVSTQVLEPRKPTIGMCDLERGCSQRARSQSPGEWSVRWSDKDTQAFAEQYSWCNQSPSHDSAQEPPVQQQLEARAECSVVQQTEESDVKADGSFVQCAQERPSPLSIMQELCCSRESSPAIQPDSLPDTLAPASGSDASGRGKDKASVRRDFTADPNSRDAASSSRENRIEKGELPAKRRRVAFCTDMLFIGRPG